MGIPVKDMLGLSGEYRGDERLSEQLREIGSPRSLPEVYGLFHGCIAAPHMVVPSQYLPLILGEAGATFKTKDEANEFLGGLMALWNRLAGWNPETEPFIGLSSDHPDTLQGLKARMTHYDSFITYFVKGLDLGGTQESDFSDDARDALRSMSEAQAFLRQFSILLQTTKAGEDADFQESCESTRKLEEVVVDCIARINTGLKPARMRTVEEMRQLGSLESASHQARSVKIGRNQPCPCGSGKKYKHCCGLTH